MNDKATHLQLDVSAEDARALHRIVRAMHDGHCPACGHLSSAAAFYWSLDRATGETDFHRCPSCQFTVTAEEARAALEAFQPILDRSVEVFERWRNRLGDPGE